MAQELNIGSDILMTDGDIAISIRGDIDTIYDDANLVQTAVNNLFIKLGEMELQPDRGNPLFGDRIKFNDSGAELVKAHCKNAILYDTRLMDVPYIEAKMLKDYECEIKFILQAVDGHIVDGSTILNIMGGGA